MKLHTTEVRRIIAGAQTEARRLGHRFVGTEHLLLAVTADREGADALDRIGVNAARVRVDVEDEIGPGERNGSPRGDIPLTGAARRVLSDFLPREAINADVSQMGTEHLILGLIREGRGVAAQALRVNGADLTNARRHLATTRKATP